MKGTQIKRKTIILFSAIVSIISVFVCAIATAAWFQIDSQPLQTSMISGTGNVSLVDNSIYGYKINPTLGADGKMNYDNDTVTKKNGSTISTENHSLDGVDTNFDVPDQGIGYYLIQENAEKTFTYTYNSVCMATKFISKTGGSTKTHYIESKALAATTYRVKHYTFVSNETVYEQVPISTTNSGAVTLHTGDKGTYDITITSAGTYKIWLNYSSATDTWDLSLEEVSYSVGGLNVAAKISNPSNRSIKRGTTVGTKSNVTQSGFDSYNIEVALSNNTDSAYWQVWNGSSNIEVYSSGTNWTNSNVNSSVWSGNDTIYLKRCEPSNHGNTWNEWTISNFKSYNWIKINDWSSFAGTIGTNLQTKSTLTIKYVNSSGVSIASDSSITCWNKESIESSSGWVSSPTVTGYSFSGWYTAATGGSVATTNAYISANATIYARFSQNSASATTYTTYLYDLKGTTASPTWTTPKAYVWGTDGYLITDNATVSYASRTTHDGHYVYQFNISITYSKLIFTSNGSFGDNLQTVDLTKAEATNKYYCLTSNTVSDGGTTKYSGTWYSSLVDMSDTFATYVYDATDTWSTLSSVKVYCWGASAIPSTKTITAVEKLTHTYYVGTSTPVTHYYYRFSIPKSYTSFDFFYGTNSGSSQTVDLTKAEGTNKYYVINGTLSGGKQSGHWYSGLVSSASYTYYYYDNSSPKKLGNTPHAYAWASVGTTADADNYTIYPYQNASWGSEVAMTPYSSWSSSEKSSFTESHPNVDTSNVWRTILSQSYDKIIFNDGTGGTNDDDQTIDEDTTDNNGLFFVLTGDTSGGRWEGYWSTDVYGITLKASFFIKTSSGTSKSSITSQQIGSDYTFGVEPFNAATASYSNIEYADSVNGILYSFEDLYSGTATWYINEACTTPYSPTTVAENVTLYRKFVADFSGDDYKTFYIDASNSGTGTSGTRWQNISICGQGQYDTPYFSSK